ncbi:MAG: hypothetical protein R3D31_18285 [Hyphomicrobiaceae bacterium]
MRKPAFAAAAIAALLASAPAQASETILIDPGYPQGATVTFESGVRVFRPLPPRSVVIVNPGGRTPVQLGIKRVTVTKHHHYHGAPGYPHAADGRIYGDTGPVVDTSGYPHGYYGRRHRGTSIAGDRIKAAPRVHHGRRSGHPGHRGHTAGHGKGHR